MLPGCKAQAASPQGRGCKHFGGPKKRYLKCACEPFEQISKARSDVSVGEADLLQIPQGPRTEACLRNNCVVGVQARARPSGLACLCAQGQFTVPVRHSAAAAGFPGTSRCGWEWHCGY